MPDASYTCACTNVKIEVKGDAMFSAYCHCTQCRRTCSAPYFHGAGFLPENITINGVSGKDYATGRGSGNPTSSYAIGKMERHFCPTCGSYVFGDARTHGFGYPKGSGLGEEVENGCPPHYIVPCSLIDYAGPNYPGANTPGCPTKPVAPMHVLCDTCVLPSGFPDDGLPKFENYPLGKFAPPKALEPAPVAKSS